MKNSLKKIPALKEEYDTAIIQYGFHKYTAKKLSCRLTIECKTLDELIIAQALGRERNWTRDKFQSIYIVMKSYRIFFTDFNPEIHTPILPIYVSFSTGVFKREISVHESVYEKNRRVVAFSKFFTLKPEFRGHKLKRFGV
jgi:hypothetical protein